MFLARDEAQTVGKWLLHCNGRRCRCLIVAAMRLRCRFAKLIFEVAPAAPAEPQPQQRTDAALRTKVEAAKPTNMPSVSCSYKTVRFHSMLA
jgi:hypothetical protein